MRKNRRMIYSRPTLKLFLMGKVVFFIWDIIMKDVGISLSNGMGYPLIVLT